MKKYFKSLLKYTEAEFCEILEREREHIIPVFSHIQNKYRDLDVDLYDDTNGRKKYDWRDLRLMELPALNISLVVSSYFLVNYRNGASREPLINIIAKYGEIDMQFLEICKKYNETKKLYPSLDILIKFIKENPNKSKELDLFFRLQ